MTDLLAGLPAVPESRVAVRVRPDTLKWVRRGHPWIWEDSITSVSDPNAAPGSLAVIFSDKGRFVAIGLWDPQSPIRVRVLHAGDPHTIDDAHWQRIVVDAAAARSGLDATGTTGWRWIHGEADGTGGLVVDRYDTTAVMKIYSTAWFPHLRSLIAAVAADPRIGCIVLRFARAVIADATAIGLDDGMVVVGEQPSGPVLFSEYGLVFEADPINGQKTGHFLDQRDNRQRVGQWSTNKTVLDVFSCTGGFSVHAAAQGARQVHSVDLARPAIETARRNMAHNIDRTSATVHRTTVGDAFEVMADLAARREEYDVIVVDPPSFASRARDRDRALRAYRKLSELALDLLVDGGRLVQASCSSRVTEDDLVDVVAAAVRDRGAVLSDQAVWGHAVDHPVTFREGQYLNAVSTLVHQRR